MEQFIQIIAKLLRKYNSNHFRKRATSVIAIIVVFVTTYSLILPVIALEQNNAASMPGLSAEAGTERQLDCSFDVHQHTDECYDERPVYDENGSQTGTEKVLICGKADYVVHQHDENCWQTVQKTITEDGQQRTVTEDVLVCRLPEISEHKHTDACYGDDGVLICGEPELHTHTIDCYESGPNGESPEQMGWVSQETDERGNSVLVGDPRHLICGKVELLAHQHGEACFTSIAPLENSSANEDAAAGDAADGTAQTSGESALTQGEADQTIAGDIAASDGTEQMVAEDPAASGEIDQTENQALGADPADMNTSENAAGGGSFI